MSKCVVCGREFEGKPYRAPRGVILCSRECYRQWRLTIMWTVQLLKFDARVGYKPGDERMRSFMSTLKWIENEDKKSLGGYIR